MIAIAAVLVLLGLGLFIGGLLTGITALYWGCVAACVVAAGVLAVARRRIAARTEAPGAPSSGAATASTTGPPAPAAPTTTAEVAPAATGPDLATGATAVPPAAPPAVAEPVSREERPAGGRERPPAGAGRARDAAPETGEPPVEEVEVTDLLIIVDLTDEVLVVDEHPRYHVAGCVHLQGHERIPLPLDEARADGFTPCGVCRPDRTLADRARARRGGG
ncbi:hypothetical protein [Blastococcus sp. SYSU DS1024]